MKTVPFNHVLMTRFNLATPGRELSIRTQPGWLESRFDLFERYCLPSVAAQTEHNFCWIIYFDKDTPPAFRERIESLRSVTNFHPYFTGLFPASGWAQSIAEVVAPQAPLLLTTRLDSDDALSKDFIERLHENVVAQTYALGAYNFTNGLTRRGDRIYSLCHTSNAFFSWLESSRNYQTACTIPHMEVAEQGHVYQLGGDPAWMQIIHDRNVSNRIRGRRAAPDAAASFIGEAGEEIARANKLTLALDHMLLSNLRSGQDNMITIAKALFGGRLRDQNRSKRWP